MQIIYIKKTVQMVLHILLPYITVLDIVYKEVNF